jgi:DNA-binding beta-propeller fold protein YncE
MLAFSAVAVVSIGALRIPSTSLVTVAGLGTAGFSGDGGPATAAQLDRPIGLAVDATTGDLYVADARAVYLAGGGQGESFTRIRKIDTAGTIRTVSGDGGVDARDGEFALAIRLVRETYLASDRLGAVYLTGASRLAILEGAGGQTAWVAKLSDGVFRIIAGGTSLLGYSGDGGPALRASLGLTRSSGLALDSEGNVYVADSTNERVRRVARDGIIVTVAGTGDRGFSGDGGPAVAAALFGPVGLAVSPDNSLYIADTNNHRVRKIDHSGNIVTVAGNGAEGFGGDGGQARDARLNLPLGLAFDSAGNLYIADSANNRVRMVDINGVITTVAGDGSSEQLLEPSAVALDTNGVLFVADTGNHRIRKLLRQ